MTKFKQQLPRPDFTPLVELKPCEIEKWDIGNRIFCNIHVIFLMERITNKRLDLQIS